MTEIAKQIETIIDSHPAAQAKVLFSLRKLFMELAPGASERISYGMPTFEISGQILIHYQGFKDHNSVFLGPEVGIRLAEELGDMVKSKGTSQLDREKLPPKSLVKKLLKTRSAILN